MIRSMTAFARAESRGDFGLIACELRSVNHRFLEPGFRLPDVLRDLEFPLRERLRQTLTRGKVDVQFRFEAADTHGAGLELDRDLAAQYVKAAGEIDQLARHAAPLNATDILRLPGVVRTREPDLVALHAPNNASLAIVGDFDPAATKALVTKYFATLKRGPAIPPIKADTPKITSERRKDVTARVELPRVYMAWITSPILKPGDADADIVAGILGGGRSSRLYKKSDRSHVVL